MVLSAAELFSVVGKNALVTGASSGIGREIALQLAIEGVNVVVSARRTDRLQTLVQDIANLKERYPKAGKAVALILDVGSSDSAIEKAVDEAWNAFGHLDILVNNAGVWAAGGVLDMPLGEHSEGYDKVFNINVKGAFIVSLAVAKKMAANKISGSIINISSAIATSAMAGAAVYGSSKAAISHITNSMARELGPQNIRVNAILPGVFPSEMSAGFVETQEFKEAMKTKLPLGKAGDVEKDLGGLVLLLASNAGSYITGSNFHVDGGWSVVGMSL